MHESSKGNSQKGCQVPDGSQKGRMGTNQEEIRRNEGTLRRIQEIHGRILS